MSTDNLNSMLTWVELKEQHNSDKVSIKYLKDKNTIVKKFD